MNDTNSPRWFARLPAGVRAVADQAVALRRELHAIPELKWQERETQARLVQAFADLGLAAQPVVDTGLLVALDGEQPGPTLLLRADLDALPVTEATGQPFASQRPGMMHACGHDAHCAIAWGIAALVRREGLARGRLAVVLQPAEEGGGGAERLLASGALDGLRPAAVLAFHVWAPYPSGRVVALDGPATAGVDAFRLVVRGRGGHAATPEALADPLVAAAAIVTVAQSLVARRVAPQRAAVLSFTSIEAPSSYNVVPDEVTLKGTVRTFEPRVREDLRRALSGLVDGTAQAHGVGASLEWVEELPPTVNDERLAAQVRAAAAAVVGRDAVLDEEPLTVGEDVGRLFCLAPGTLALLGAAPAVEEVFPHHHARFDIDERVIALGIALGREVLRSVTEREVAR